MPGIPCPTIPTPDCLQCAQINEYCLAGQPLRTSREEGKPSEQREAPHVSPTDQWTCPASHPVKGNFTTNSGERCTYHVPGGQFHGKTKPERCYATEDEARRVPEVEAMMFGTV